MDGLDSIYFYYNLAIDIENIGYGFYFNLICIVVGRGGIVCV